MKTRLSRRTRGLRSMRIARGWTQEVAARHGGISQSTQCLLELGKRTPSVALLRRLARLYGPDVIQALLNGGR